MGNLPKINELKRYLFVVNPISGERDKSSLFTLIDEYAYNFKWEYKIYNTNGKNDVEEIQKLFEEYKPEIAVAVGGDGTVSLVAELLEHKDIALGIIPAGSGNGLSKDLQIPQNDYEDALNKLAHGRIAKMDTLRANNFFFMHLADIGFNAHIVKLFNRSKGRGLSTYIKFVLKEFFNYPTNYYEVITDAGEFKGNAFMITIANSNQYGSNLTINPEGNWSDGKFEVIIIKRFPKKQAFNIFFRLLFKKIQFSPHCIILKCTKATVYCEKKKTLQYDGEVAKKVRKAEFTIMPQSLNIIVP